MKERGRRGGGGSEGQEAARWPMNNGRLSKVKKEGVGGQKIVAKDRKGDGGKNKGKGKMEGAYVEGLLAGTPGRNRLAIRCDEMRASGRGRGMMRDDTPGCTSVHQKLEDRIHIS